MGTWRCFGPRSRSPLVLHQHLLSSMPQSTLIDFAWSDFSFPIVSDSRGVSSAGRPCCPMASLVDMCSSDYLHIGCRSVHSIMVDTPSMHLSDYKCYLWSLKHFSSWFSPRFWLTQLVKDLAGVALAFRRFSNVSADRCWCSLIFRGTYLHYLSYWLRYSALGMICPDPSHRCFAGRLCYCREVPICFQN